MTRLVTVDRNLAGFEDLIFGFGSVTQNRNGRQVSITKLNAQNIPFDELRTLKKVVDDLEAIGIDGILSRVMSAVISSVNELLEDQAAVLGNEIWNNAIIHHKLFFNGLV